MAPMQQLYLSNTFSGKKECFVPLDPKHITMYVCGPTVYSHPHIGNARPAVVFDLLFRLLQHHYPKVTYVRNITDIDDKINAAAAQKNIPIQQITNHFTKVYHQDLTALGCCPPSLEPRATEHIQAIINLIQTLIKQDHAYALQDGHVLFDITSDPKYGALAKKSQADILSGARVEVATYKKNPSDFILWKPSNKTQPGWQSPWGLGRPGWHIECSAMIHTHLGKTIDIHGGGQDLVFPHHENERAQACCAYPEHPYVRYWVHNGFVKINQEKMSKSLGNILIVDALLKQSPGEVIRLALLSTHYHKPLSWSDNTLKQAHDTLTKWYQILKNTHYHTSKQSTAPQAIIAALNDDLNTPLALTHLHQIFKKLAHAKTKAAQTKLHADIEGAGKLLGLFSQPVTAFVATLTHPTPGHLSAQEIERLITARNHARANKDFAKADEIRDQLQQAGVNLMDQSTGDHAKK
jgi:cysteinyl-tRNA synthetase